ncbi:arogenate dehydrogenase 1, chloroplastic-like [Humulus lupulus]|uniref:arogenate dehydrogenase 1, chloroplastic-like n=1 Tax=Humulus lupulus TaxID=3486 RepID=UPI002B4056F9|nr:arogenate dehydrogenase 1, chloroplastic-like [Humulus lupulus]
MTTMCDSSSSASLSPSSSSTNLKIGIVGFGPFAQFLAKSIIKQGHTLKATSRTDYTDLCVSLDISFFRNVEAFLEAENDVVLICTSILSLSEVFKSMPFQCLKRPTLFVDVLSVKEYPKKFLLQVLPEESDLLCTHPMFGPESGNNGWKGLAFVFERVRIRNEATCSSFLQIFESEGCQMLEMSCEEHDKVAAKSQFLTHTIGRVLAEMKIESTPMNTKSFETLLKLKENTLKASLDLYSGLFLRNRFAIQELENLELAIQKLKQKLLDRMNEEQDILISPKNLVTNSQTTTMYSSSSSTSFSPSSPSTNLKIGIVGFGPFAQFLAKTIIKQGHTLRATSRTDYADLCVSLGVSFFRDVEAFLEAENDVVLICTSILSLSEVVKSMSFQCLKRHTLFVDVLSVKEYPKTFLLQVLPEESDVLCTHPMFGPESGKNGWKGLTFVFERVRIRNEATCSSFLQIFESEGCQMLEMSCEDHDKVAAKSQFLTHTIGRVLSEMRIESTPMNTKGFETLIQLKENTMKDSFDLYSGLFLQNRFAKQELENLELAIQKLKQKLLDRMKEEQDISAATL